MKIERYNTRVAIAIVISIFLIGSFFRIYFLVINRSLWLDEAMLALNIIDRSFLNLLKPLDYNQGAPIGFLLLQKVVVCLFGKKDYVLRLIPLAAGLASIPIMYTVAKRYGGGISPYISFGLFALSPKLIYYSSEVKQYSSDVLITVLLLLISHKFLEDKNKTYVLALFGIAGTFVAWISHPSLFIIGGVILSLGLTCILHKDKYHLRGLIVIGVLWGISFGINYFTSLRHLESNNHLINYWSDGFAPIPTFDNLGWYTNSLIGFLQDPATLAANVIIVGLFIIGIISYAFRRWQLLMALFLPFLFTLIASVLGRYPFIGRMLLFLLPVLFLILAEGVERVRVFFLRVNPQISVIITLMLFFYTFSEPIITTINNFRSPSMVEDIKPVMTYIKEKRRNSDIIYVYYGAGPAFEFYAPQLGFTQNDFIIGLSARDDPYQYLEDIDKVRGNHRVWIVFAHNCHWCIVNEQEFILDHLNDIGSRKGKFSAERVSTYLFDLSQTP